MSEGTSASGSGRVVASLLPDAVGFDLLGTILAAAVPGATGMLTAAVASARVLRMDHATVLRRAS